MTAAWNSKEESYPRVTATIFKEYASKKREGNLGQQQNPERNGIAMLKKILCIPTIPLREIGLKSARANKEEHVYNVLHNSNIGKSTALYIRPSTL